MNFFNTWHESYLILLAGRKSDGTSQSRAIQSTNLEHYFTKNSVPFANKLGFINIDSSTAPFGE